MTPDFYASVGGKPFVTGNGEIAWFFGRFLAAAPRDARSFHEMAPHLKDFGAGKVALLYEAARKVMGQDLDPGPQKIGDCVSWGWSGSVDLLACVQVVAGQAQGFSWELRTCTEATYALSRVEVGGQRGSYEDGSTGEWAAGAVTRYGTISRQKLGPYDSRRAKEWGAKGISGELETLAREHLVKQTALIASFEEARDFIASAQGPVPVCSGVGFEGRRDSKGFIRRRGQWSHCMKFVASRDDGTPGLLCMNSWGLDHADEPKGEFDIPGNSWWVTPDDANAMLRERDSFGPSGFVGYAAPDWQIPWMF